MRNASQSTWRLRIFVATWLAYVGFYFCRKPFSVAKGTLGSELHLSATDLGTIGAAYLIAYALGQFLAGTLGSRLGARRLFLLGMALSIVATIAFGLGGGFAFLAGMMVANGLGQAVGWPAGVGLMAAWFGHAERGRAMGLWATNFQVGSLLSTFVTAAVLVRWGWQATFFVGAAVLAVLWVVNAVVLVDRPEDIGFPAPLGATGSISDESVSPWTRDLVIDVLLIGVFYFFLKLIRYALWSWVPFFLQHNYGLNSDNAGYLSTLFDIAGIPGVFFYGLGRARDFGCRRAKPRQGIIFVVLATNLVVFALCLALVGFSLFGPDALMTGAGAMDLGDRRIALQVTGIIVSLGACGPVVQELVIGRLYDSQSGDLHVIFALLFGSAAISTAALALRVIRERKTAARR